VTNTHTSQETEKQTSRSTKLCAGVDSFRGETAAEEGSKDAVSAAVEGSERLRCTCSRAAAGFCVTECEETSRASCSTAKKRLRSRHIHNTPADDGLLDAACADEDEGVEGTEAIGEQ
jgi:hypothetical protein